MKKFATLSILAATLLFAGCSQQAPPESANSTPNAEPAANESKAPSDYPKSSIEVVIPFAPGGGTDTVGRILSNYVSKYLPNNQSVVIVNKPGGSGIIGLAEVQNAKPDGYKIGMTTEPPLSVQPHYGKAPYTHDSFQTIMRVTSIPLVLVVKKDAPWQTYEEWRDYVKQNPEKFHYATAGVGTTGHIVMESLNDIEGIKTKSVAFDGGGPQMNAVLGGHVQGGVVQFTEAKQYIDSGEVRVLINFAETKSEAIPVDSLKDKGIDLSLGVYTGIVAPKDLDPAIVTVLHDAFKKALEDPEAVAQLEKLGIQPFVAYAGPEDFQKEVTDKFNSHGETMKKLGLIK